LIRWTQAGGAAEGKESHKEGEGGQSGKRGSREKQPAKKRAGGAAGLGGSRRGPGKIKRGGGGEIQAWGEDHINLGGDMRFFGMCYRKGLERKEQPGKGRGNPNFEEQRIRTVKRDQKILARKRSDKNAAAHGTQIGPKRE